MKFLKIKILILPLIIIAVGMVYLGFQQTPENKINKTNLTTKITKMEMPFIANQGQVNDKVAFYARTFGGTVYVTEEGEIVYSITKREKRSRYSEPETQKSRSTRIKETLVGANINKVKADKKAVTKVSYYMGNDKSKWRNNIPTYSYVDLGEVYDDIELKLKAYSKNVEKLFYVKPGADSNKIKLKIEGAKLGLTDNGELKLETTLGDVQFTKPIAYQIIDNNREDIKVAYAIDKNEYGFEVGSYNKSETLIIDPLLASTFIGNTNVDIAEAIAIDSSDNVFIAGYTESSDFPTTTGAFDESYNDSAPAEDIFISKFSNNLATLSASTFLGTSANDFARGIAIDSSDKIYIVGDTSSGSFPMPDDEVAYYDESHNSSSDVIVSKFSNDLSNLEASTYLGGSGIDYGYSIAIDSSTNIFIAGKSKSTNFDTTTGAYDESHNGGGAGYDIVVAKFNSTLTSLSASTYLGGADDDEMCAAVAIDSSNNVFVAGCTESNNFPTTTNAYDESFNDNTGTDDGFISKFTNDLATLSASTYFGSATAARTDEILAIAIDSSNNIYVTGSTQGSDFPTVEGCYDTVSLTDVDPFVSKFTNDLETLSASTYLDGGSSGTDRGYAIVIDSSDNVYVAGYGAGTSFPTAATGYDTSHNGNDDAFISKLNSGLTTLSAGTFIGHSADDIINGIALDSSGNVFVTGNTDSSSFPTTSGAYDETYNDTSPDYDVFVAKFNSDLSYGSFTVSATSISVAEGADGTFTVKLSAAPSNNVTIAVSSSDTSTGGTVSPSSLTFTLADSEDADYWSTNQTVTVTGVNDDIDDADVNYTITLGAASSDDTRYSGLDPADLSATTTDNDTVGFSFVYTDSTTGEDLSTGSYTVALASEPTANVTIGVSSSDTNKGTVDKSSLTFTSGNWDTPQTLTITGVDDDGTIGGTLTYNIVLAADGSTADTKYNGLDPEDREMTNTDNDSAGFTISESSITTTEAGGTDTFTVKLSGKPTADVTIGVSSDDSGNTGEGNVSTASLTFTSENFNTPQTVTVTGVDDDLDDGNIAYNIVLAAASSADENFNGENPTDVNATNTDNDTAGFSVSSISQNTTEAGPGTATFTVVLDSEPTADVTISNIRSNDTTEGNAPDSNAHSLTFLTSNWSDAQTVTITGVDDDVDDGDVAYTIVLDTTSSSDGNYNSKNPNDVSVTNTDDDTAGFTVSSISENTTEAGGTATFTVVLDSEPTANVTISNIRSNDTTEGNAPDSNAHSLTFTAANWDDTQTVTITGVDDDIDDDDTNYTILLDTTSSSDGNYNSKDPGDVSATNTDDDTAGYTISAISGDTSEAGATATFTVKLNSEPTANVVVTASSADTTEGTVPNSNSFAMTFTNANWNDNQTVTVTGVSDEIIDGSIAYTINQTVSSDDSVYDALDPADVSVTNTDSPGFTVSETSITTTEAGGTDTFTVKLNTQPTANVVIGVSSSDTGEGTVSASSLTFTNANWNSTQTITVTGVNDDLADGNQGYTIVLAAATSSDGNYNGLNPADVSATNNDDDTPGFNVGTISQNTTETEGTATFTVKLNTEPTADVTISNIRSNDTTEGTTPSSNSHSLTFTSANWNDNQTVTVTGVNDDVEDGDIAYSIVLDTTSSSDSDYNTQNPSDVSATNTDDDTAGITVSKTSVATTEDGNQESFTIVLDSEPTDDVTIAVSSSDTGEGTVSSSSLTFTSANWDTTQTITVTGVDDDLIDGTQNYTITIGAASSSDGNYNGINPTDLTATNANNDTGGFTISAISGNTTEAGGTATFTIQLLTEPSYAVTIPLSSSDLGEGTVPTNIIIEADDWDAVDNTVTVTGVDDAIDDGNQEFTIVLGATTSIDSDYSGLNPNDVEDIINEDNDTAGFTVGSISGNTTEAGGTATFTVALQSQPTEDVTTSISSSDTAEGTVSPSSVTFEVANWNTPQTVTVTGVDDDVGDGSQNYTIVLAAATSDDTDYNGIDPSDVTATNTDDDTPGVTSSLISGDTTEAGGTATFTVSLESQPTDDVTIPMTSSDEGEGTASPASLTFTSLNWNGDQLVTVTGVDDDVQDGSQNYTILLGDAVSDDTNYDAFDPNADVSVTNTDNDTAGFTASAISGNATEEGGQGTFTVQLNTQPTYDVTFPVITGDEGEGTVSPSSLTFTSANWNSVNHIVTITGVDDEIVDGNQTFTITLGEASSTDSNYDGLDPDDVSATNIDDETGGLIISAVSNSVTEEDGDLREATFTVRLTAQSLDDVQLAISSADTGEGTALPSLLTFTSENFDQVQTITVTGVDDEIEDGDQSFNIVLTPSSDNTSYDGLDPSNVSVTNIDDDTAGFTIAATDGYTSEAGGKVAITVRLNTEPLTDVLIGVESSDITEGLVYPASLEFTSENWNEDQNIVVTGASDTIDDGDQEYIVTLSKLMVSSDGEEIAYASDYEEKEPENVSLTNLDSGSLLLLEGLDDELDPAVIAPTINVEEEEDGIEEKEPTTAGCLLIKEKNNANAFPFVALLMVFMVFVYVRRKCL